jgi:hypothetical protein
MSEFGKGYATCLIQFVNHRARLNESLSLYERMRRTEPDLFRETGAVEAWANGASDHFYEIERPTGLQDGEWSAAAEVARRALDIGHGFRPSSKSDPAEAKSLLSEAECLLLSIGVQSLPEALAWDAAHGLTPEEGDWSCPANLSRVPA